VYLLRFLGRQNFLNAYLVNEVVAFQIGQMRSLFVVWQMRPDPVRHRHYEAAIIHVQPITSTNKFVRGIPRKRAIGLGAKVGFAKSWHKRLKA
jgi:hypothetical protein